jgi:TRAP-type transport system periplasmic protein
MKKILICLLTLAFVNSAWAIKIKIAAVVPEGNTMAKALKSMAKEIKKKTKGKVKLKLYLGGVAGDEADVLRKVKIGQLHGAIFTGRALGEINGDVRAFETPFNFHRDDAFAQRTLEKLGKTYDGGFVKGGFKNLGFFELGPIYLVSSKKAAKFDELNGIKIWAWEGDELVSTMLETMKLVSVPLPLSDVLSSLSTGVIEAAYGCPMCILAMQWQSKVKYLFDYPVSYAISSFVVSQKRWKKVKPEHKKIIEEIVARYAKKTNVLVRQENVEALKTMKDSGIKFLQFPPADIKKGNSIRKEVISKLEGKLFSSAALKKLTTVMSKEKKRNKKK